MDSPSWKQIMEALDKQGEAWNAFKKTNDERIEAMKSGNESKEKELNAKLEKIEREVSKTTQIKDTLEMELQIHKDRIEELEAARVSPGKTQTNKLVEEYTGAFNDWMRHGLQDQERGLKLKDLEKRLLAQNPNSLGIRGAITIATGAPGGYAVPEQIAREIERHELLFSPVRDLVKVINVGTSDYKELLNLRGAASGWVGESGSRTETATPTFREITPTHGELYAYPQASEWSLDDMFFNVEAWLAEEVAQEFALQEGTAVITGNGTSKPTGMLNTSPVTTDDFASPLRAAAAYEYIDSTASPAALVADQLHDLVHLLRSPYRANATWVMNSTVMGAVRKLKDSQNQYLWQPGLQNGTPDILLGYPHRTWEQMPSIAAGNFPLAFGDFRRGYVLTQRTGLRITSDQVTNIGFVRFYVRRREGGIVLNNDAIKWIRT